MHVCCDTRSRSLKLSHGVSTVWLQVGAAQFVGQLAILSAVPLKNKDADNSGVRRDRLKAFMLANAVNAAVCVYGATSGTSV